jgi:hypothetical protein
MELGEKWSVNLTSNSDFQEIAGFFYKPQICDMGLTDLLPL